jgi:thiamine transporter ThiT
MEELKLLVEMVSNLPAMALWVIAFFFGYKVLIVGSIYGVIRFCVQKGYDSIVAWKIKAPCDHRMLLRFDGSTPPR